MPGVHALILLAGVLLAASPVDAEAPAFTVRFDAAVRSEPASGRLLIFLLRQGARVGPRARPADAPFYDDPQPIYGVDVTDLHPGVTMTIGRGVRGFPVPLDELPEAGYRVQAVFDMARENSDWSREPGNLYSSPVAFTMSAENPDFTVDLVLDSVVRPRTLPAIPGVEWFEAPSAMLSEFRGRPVVHRAGIVLPEGYDPTRKYPTVYFVPGFSGDHTYAARIARSGQMTALGGEIRRHAFIIALDPESENGHTLFADSRNNGPCASALIGELIPALESRYPLIPAADARIVTGHSSGGWSSVWLAVTHPEVFGACFAGSPDPVEFRAFQKVNLYQDHNFYIDASGKEIASNEQRGASLMTIRQENQWEEVRGPDNTSGQQWDSWQAVFGPRNERGRPAALFDPATGVIDRDIAETYRRFDVGERLASDPDRLGPVFRDRVRIIVGGDDEWNLSAAVALLRDRLAMMGHPMDGAASFGRINIVPGADHGTVTQSPVYRAIGGEMVNYFRKAGHIKP